MEKDQKTSISPPKSEPVSDAIHTAADMMRSLEKIKELPTLSSVAMRLNTMLQDPETSAETLAEEISKDQSMVVKLLKLANSAFFGLTARVGDISHAVMILGFKTAFNAVLSMAVVDAFRGKHSPKGFSMSQFWEHAIRVAVVSRHLEETSGGQISGSAFTAGIIHDVGKVVMAGYYPHQFNALCGYLETSDVSFYMAEQQHFPMGHSGVGAFLTRRWLLPDSLTNVVGRHHNPDMLPNPNALVLIVHTADAIVNRFMENHRPMDHWQICASAQEMLDHKIETVEQWLPGLAPEISAACQSFLAA